MKTTFVTGGCGFVGRHLVKRLLGRGDKVYIVDDLSTGVHPSTWLEDMSNVVFIEADLLNFLQAEMISKTLPDFDEAYHLASIVGGRLLIDGDPLMVAKDLAIDAIFFMWLTRKATRVNAVLYASSSAAYPIFNQTKENTLTLTEDMISYDENLSMPDMTYGWSKLTGEYLSVLAHKKYGQRVMCVRPFSGYGEDQDLTYPTPSIAQRVARHDSPIEVWGTGEQGRDFIYIEDCISAMLLITEKGTSGEAYNIGTGILTSFNELIKTMSAVENHSADILRLTDKPVGVHNRVGSPSKLKAELNWEPEYSLEYGCKMMLDFAHNRDDIKS